MILNNELKFDQQNGYCIGYRNKYQMGVRLNGMSIKWVWVWDKQPHTR